MAIDSLQRYLELFPTACVPVDLKEIAKSNESRKSGKFSLLIDGECCLNRFYGGYFNDWVCGGQWNRMFRFMRSFVLETQRSNIEITVCLNGAQEPERMSEWIQKQQCDKDKMRKILKHLDYKGTPPPKVWWIGPNSIRSCLRNLLRQLKVNVVVTTTDHHLEIISYMKIYNYQGLIADDPDYLIFDPPHYFSSINLKLTYKGGLETKEYLLSEVTSSLGLHPSRVYLVAALLGNHILEEADLASFHTSLCPQIKGLIPPSTLINAVADFVKNLPSDDLSRVAFRVFGSSSDSRCEKFKRSAFYYCRGYQKDDQSCEEEEKDDLKDADCDSKQLKDDNMKSISSKFASDTLASEVSEDPTQNEFPHEALGCHLAYHHGEHSTSGRSWDMSSIETSSSGSTKDDSSIASEFEANVSLETTTDKIILPIVSPEVMEISLARHQKGLMHPFIYQILSRGEIKIPVILEDDNGVEIPCSSDLYRPLRQMVYAVLFSEHHLQYVHKKEMADPVPKIVIKEWIWSKSNKYKKPDLVPSQLLGWPVPTVSGLWLRPGPDGNRLRMKAFLTCMRSYSLMMCDPCFVPQRFIILCCVLRYFLSSPEMPFLHKYELDAFLAQAVDPNLRNPDYAQKLELPVISPRGVTLASLFMQGVDLAIMANDACGAPVPWPMCCPWLFFDGKLFHQKLIKAFSAKNLTDLCDNQFEEVSYVEQMRAAIVEGLSVKYLPPAMHPTTKPVPLPPRPMVYPYGHGRGRGSSFAPQGGGQLQVGGVVVGSWAPNYSGGQHPRPTSFRGSGKLHGNSSKTLKEIDESASSYVKYILENQVHAGLGMGRGAPNTSSKTLKESDDSSSSYMKFQLENQVPAGLGMGRGAPNTSKTLKESYDSSSSNLKSQSANKATVCLGMGRGAPKTEQANKFPVGLGMGRGAPDTGQANKVPVCLGMGRGAPNTGVPNDMGFII